MSEARKPTALTIADDLEMWTLGEPAATELRRLYAENVVLHERHAGDNKILREVETQRDELLALLQIVRGKHGCGILTLPCADLDRIDKAIAKVTN